MTQMVTIFRTNFFEFSQQADWHAQRDVGFRSAVEYTLRQANQFFAAEARQFVKFLYII